MVRDDPTIGLAYIYYNFQGKSVQKIKDILASLLAQLAYGRPSLPQGMINLFNKHQSTKTQPLLDELSRTLCFVAEVYLRVFIVIDALDECEDSSRKKVLDELFNLQIRSSRNILATFRMDKGITNRFDGCRSKTVNADNNDVRKYVNMQIKDLDEILDGDL
jgi:hypothetical protein